MPDYRISAKRQETVNVDDSNAISFLGADGPRVLSTPNMILYMEQTCRNLVLEMLDPGHDSLGTHVNVSHCAAAPIGSAVTFHAELLEVNKRRVDFRVAAMLGAKVIGEGTHQRAVIDVNRFAGKVKEENA